MDLITMTLVGGQLVTLAGLIAVIKRHQQACAIQHSRIDQLQQRLAAAEQMQSLLARAHKSVLLRAQQTQTPDETQTSQDIYEQANQLISKGCEAAELSRSLKLPLEEAEIMVQLGRLKQTA